jgi:hypothetical protein
MHIKRQATRRDCLPSLLYQWIVIVYGEEKKMFWTGPVGAAKAGQNCLVPAWRSQGTNKGRICTIWVQFASVSTVSRGHSSLVSLCRHCAKWWLRIALPCDSWIRTSWWCRPRCWRAWWTRGWSGHGCWCWTGPCPPSSLATDLIHQNIRAEHITVWIIIVYRRRIFCTLYSLLNLCSQKAHWQVFEPQVLPNPFL